MQVMTFGETCSVFTNLCAVRIKNYNSVEWSKSLSRADLAIKRNHYVDDWLDSVDSDSEAVKFILLGA